MPTDSFLLREVSSFCHEFILILKSKWRDLNSRLGGCGIYVSKIYFSIFLKNKEEEKDWSDPQPDSAIQPKARGATPYGARVLRAPYMIKILGLEHLTASEQSVELGRLLDVLKGRPRSNQKDVLTTWSTQRRLAKYSMPAGLGYEELGGLSDPGQRDSLKA